MEEKLVSFEIAMLAKEKGFNVQTFSNCWVKTLDGDIIHNSERKDIVEHDRCEQYLMQPTYSQLQTWLRKGKTIDVEVKVYTRPHYCVSIVTPTSLVIDVINPNTIYEEHEFAFKSYDEALEEGLKSALNLI